MIRRTLLACLLLAMPAAAGAQACLGLPPRAHIGRHAYVVCTADDPDTCADRLTAAADLVELTYDAVNEPEFSGRPW